MILKLSSPHYLSVRDESNATFMDTRLCFHMLIISHDNKSFQTVLSEYSTTDSDSVKKHSAACGCTQK